MVCMGRSGDGQERDQFCRNRDVQGHDQYKRFFLSPTTVSIYLVVNTLDLMIKYMNHKYS